MNIITDYAKQSHSVASLVPATDSQSPLGNLANISSRTQKFEISTAQRKKTRRFNLLDSARKLLRNRNVQSSTGKAHRTRYCLAVRHDKTQDIGIMLNDNESESLAGLQNLVTCGSICSCPVCAHRLMLEKAQDIKKALIYGENHGLVPIMLTLTAQHHKNGTLQEFKDNFKSAWQYFSSGRQWKEFKTTYGIRYYITAREVTRQRQRTPTDKVIDNGWHYHMHILLFLDPKNVLLNDQIEDIHGKFAERWMKALNRNDLNGIPEIACDLRAGAHVGEHYLTKLGLAENMKGELDYELTGSENKGATIWDILEDAAWGDHEAEYQYLEYVEVMSGENWITFSHGLRDLIADVEVPVTQEQSESSKLSLWYWITQENWNIVVQSHAVGTVLIYAAKYRSREMIAEFIEALKHERERKIRVGIYDNG